MVLVLSSGLRLMCILLWIAKEKVFDLYANYNGLEPEDPSHGLSAQLQVIKFDLLGHVKTIQYL